MMFRAAAPLSPVPPPSGLRVRFLGHATHKYTGSHMPPTPLRIGLDLDDTITAAPALFSRLTDTLLGAGCEVHIVTYRPDSSPDAVARDLTDLGIRWTHIHLPRGFDTPPHLWKRATAAAAALDLLIDDDPGVIDAVASTTVALRFTAP